MKQTNHQLFDFLDFDPALKGYEALWKSCAPVEAFSDGHDVVFEIPFQKQIVSSDIVPDYESGRKNYFLRLRAYGNRILRIGIGFNVKPMPDSSMLEISGSLKVKPLLYEKDDAGWRVMDSEGTVRACLNRRPVVTDHWSDLIPPPEETLDLSFFPERGKEIKLSAYDQFFPSHQDAFPLAFVEKEGKCNRVTMSFHARPDEMFAGTGERFASMDLSGHTFELKNQDGQGVNSRRTYKNIPFFIFKQDVWDIHAYIRIFEIFNC